jgi:hypothetical protein
MLMSKDLQGLIHRVGMSLWKRLGSCPRCVRSAFRAAFMAWVLTGFGLAIPFSPPFFGLTKIVAFALTTLWLGHLLAHAIKVSTAARLRQQGINDARVVSRRNTLPIFTRALAMAALATSLPNLAFADCDQATAQCQAAAANCRANCDRAFHREEVDQACHRECYSRYAACKAEARCS